MRNESQIKNLLESAAEGTDTAWREIMRRYSSLVYSRCRRYGLTGSDAEDVAGNVWLNLVGALGNLREPAALPGWLSTTTRRECLAVLREQRRHTPDERVDEVTPDAAAALVDAEQRVVVRAALTSLSERDRELLSLLFGDPPMPYAQISSQLGIPIGTIGPTRQRCLAKVRGVPSVAALMRDCA